MSAGCVTRYSVPSRALGTTVSVLADHDAAERSLRVEVSAGEFPVRSVRLIDARGRTLRPDSAVQRRDELRGGVRLGVGLGLGGGFDDHKRLRGSTGLGRRVGGRWVPGPHIARFLDPPLQAQPWTLRVTTGGEQQVTTEVLLAEIENLDEIEADPAAPRRLKLVTGEIALLDDRAEGATSVGDGLFGQGPTNSPAAGPLALEPVHR